MYKVETISGISGISLGVELQRILNLYANTHVLYSVLTMAEFESGMITVNNVQKVMNVNTDYEPTGATMSMPNNKTITNTLLVILIEKGQPTL